MNFLVIARKSSFMPMKVAMYIPVLEALFSKSRKDSKTDIAEACVAFLNEPLDSSYNIIIRAYNLRSKLLHGVKLLEDTATLKKQIKLSKGIDAVTRKVLSKAIMENYPTFLAEDIVEEESIWAYTI